VSIELLRAWERRYDLLHPSRTSGGFRLYSVDDEERVRRMRAEIERGLSAREAAETVGRPSAFRPPGLAMLPDLRARLGDALDRMDEPSAESAFDELLAGFGLETVLSEVMIPYLHDLGDRWQAGNVSVATEHFASNLVRGRLLALARGWGRGNGSLAMLACAPEERHDIGLIMFGLMLRQEGWRISFLGADTPIDGLEAAVRSAAPDLVVLSASDRARLTPIVDEIRSLGLLTDVALAGPGAGRDIADRAGAKLLSDDLIGAARVVASG